MRAQRSPLFVDIVGLGDLGVLAFDGVVRLADACVFLVDEWVGLGVDLGVDLELGCLFDGGDENEAFGFLLEGGEAKALGDLTGGGGGGTCSSTSSSEVASDSEVSSAEARR